MIEVIFLLALAFIWILFAAISDVRTTEIPNWLNFSLIIFALGFRFFYSLFEQQGFNFFYQGLIGTGIFLALGTGLYYSRAFAGGDAKLMIALGPILSFSINFFTNLEIAISFLFLFLVSGSAYSILASTYFAFKNHKNFKKEFRIAYKTNLKFNIVIMMFGILIMVGGIILNGLLLYLGIIIFIIPLLYLYTKSVDETMRKKISPKDLMEGDWLYRDVKVGNKSIKANWGGLTQEDINLLQKKNKSVLIKRGIAFGPVFLIGFLLLIYFYFTNTGLWNSLW
jgi:Flp pilus assembly protein protease CpaA